MIYTISTSLVKTDKSQRLQWAVHLYNSDGRNKKHIYRMSVRKSVGKLSPGRLRRKQEDSIKIDLSKTSSQNVNWLEVTQNNMLQWTTVKEI